MDLNKLNIGVIGHVEHGMSLRVAEIVARLNLENSPMIVVADNEIIYNGSGEELNQVEIDAIVAKSRPIELEFRPIPELLDDLIPKYVYQGAERKSDNQPWAKCNRRGKFHK